MRSHSLCSTFTEQATVNLKWRVEKMKMLEFKICNVALVAVALTLLAAPYAGAAVVTLNFDDIVSKDQAESGVDATPYLALYGITLSNVSPDGPSGAVQIWNWNHPGSDWIDENFLDQNGGGAPPCSYTMNFSTPLQSVSFTRIATPPDLQTTPEWSATAYVGTEDVGSVGEGYGTWGYSSPAHNYTLSGNGITSLTIYSNGYNFTGIGTVPLDHFVLTSVPEPGTLTLAATGIGFLLVLQLRRKRSSEDGSTPHS